MLPGPAIIKVCPQCGGQVIQPTLSSGNTFGATYWTDGKMEAEMLPEDLLLVKCPFCQKLFWVDKPKELGQVECGELGDTWPDAKDLEEPSEEDYLAFLKTSPPRGKAKEKYLRIHAWWAANDRVREGATPGVEAVFSADARDSLNALYALLNEVKQDQRLMKAEIARELGRFDEAVALLTIRLKEDFVNAADQIRQLATAKNKDVAEIT